MMKAVSEVHNFFFEYGDAKVSADFPLMYGAPWKLMAIIAAYAMTALYFGPKWMKDRKPIDNLRPWMLVFNGFMFGVSGAGFLIALWITELGTNSWSCTLDSDRWEGISGVMMRYLGLVYTYIKMFDFMSTAFDMMRKRDNVDYKGQVLHNSSLVIYAYFGTKFYPKGCFVFLPLLDLLFQTVRLSYLVLASAGSGLKHALGWKRYVGYAQLAQQLTLMAHSVHVLSVPDCAGPNFLKVMPLLYAIGTMAYTVAFFKRTYLTVAKKTQ
ncbi:putative protein for very long chain fatty acid elongation [Halotydeus destructor]|nr:putative protein for very long chain fatty acid elongation [Halotydeus destructor]